MLAPNHLQSENIADLVTALAKAQAEMESASFDRVNPHFKSKYASYNAFRESGRIPLSKNGLAITHLLDVADNKRLLVTQLSHISGQWLRSIMVIPLEKETPQSLGSAISYCKRYAYSSLMAIGADEDDDGEEAESTYRESAKLSRIQAKEIEEMCDDPEFLNRILRAYKVTNLLAINASEYNTILKRIQLTKEKTHASVGT